MLGHNIISITLPLQYLCCIITKFTISIMLYNVTYITLLQNIMSVLLGYNVISDTISVSMWNPLWFLLHKVASIMISLIF